GLGRGAGRGGGAPVRGPAAPAHRRAGTATMNGWRRRFWPPAEVAQVDYERLRAAALAGTPLLGPTATCVARRGLAGLLTWPAAGLDGLRDAAEAGVVEGVWCLSPDRLARVYAWQVVVLDELARLGVAVRFVDAPALDDDPQARLLTQVQGVIAEYERAKIAERYR